MEINMIELNSIQLLLSIIIFLIGLVIYLYYKTRKETEIDKVIQKTIFIIIICAIISICVIMLFLNKIENERKIDMDRINNSINNCDTIDEEMQPTNKGK